MGDQELHKELKKVKVEVQLIDEQIRELKQRKTLLNHRKSEIERLLSSAANVGDPPNDAFNKSNFPWSDKVEKALTDVFKLNTFRSLQLSAINATMSGKDCLIIMPTGGGKSLCFQLPAVVSDGVTLVVSPLVSLMEDQLMALKKLNIQAALLNASSSKVEVKFVHDAMTTKNHPLKLLYVTPEKLSKSKRFMAKVEKMYEMGRLARIAIDEVHCCSQWGHDFRPDYKILGILKRQFPGTPVIGLTATATKNVLEDVKKMLNIPDCKVLQASFNRKNLIYEVRQKSSVQKDATQDLVDLINTRFCGKSGIVYCFSQSDADNVAQSLCGKMIKAASYHAGLISSARTSVHEKWVLGKVQVIVATVAFGMGIDKPDVRFVIHHSLSKSMENYYQESGRAGRDDQTAHCILFFRFADMFRQSTMVFTEQTGLTNLYGMIAYCLDQTTCRRSMIARHFGERWDSSLCEKMCDHCKLENTYVDTIDITQNVLDILGILEKGASLDQRLTAQKVLDAWTGKGPKNIRPPKPTTIGRDTAESVLAHLVIEGYIKEDFHFTPYSTISYLLPGARANIVRLNGKKVTMDLRKRKRLSATPSAALGSSDLTKSSSFATSTSASAKRESLPGKPENNEPRNGKEKHKKRSVIIDSDSDSDFEFCEVTKPVSKRICKDNKKTDSQHIDIIISDDD